MRTTSGVAGYEIHLSRCLPGSRIALRVEEVLAGLFCAFRQLCSYYSDSFSSVAIFMLLYLCYQSTMLSHLSFCRHSSDKSEVNEV